MSFILGYLKKYRLPAILAPTFKMLEAIFELLVPLVMISIIDVGIAKNDRAYVLRMSILLTVLAVMGLLFSVTAQFFAAKVATSAAGDMRKDLFSHIMDFSERQMDRIGADTLLTRITSDLNAVQGGVNMFLRLFLRSPFVVLGAMVMAGTISIKAMAFFAAVIMLLAVIVAFIMRTTVPLYERVQAYLDKLATLVRENLEGVRVIRAFARSDKETENFSQRNNRLYKTAKRAGKWQILMSPVTYGLINLAIVILLYRSSFSVRSGVLTTGEVVALYNYMSQILVELVKFATLIIQVTRAYASAKRVSEVMGIEADERIHTSGVEADLEDYAVEFDSVKFSYDGGENDLEEVSFSVKKGDTLGIVGGTGSGKSTIIRLLRHAYDAGNGGIRIFGMDVKSISPQKMSAIVANVPQKVELLAGTIRSNLSLGSVDATEEQMWEALKIAQAADFVKDKGGLDSEVARGGTNFSGGQKQRISIARALVMGPSILLLDDATSALDASTEKALLDELGKIEDLSVIIISQRASSVKEADNIIVMEDGWLVGSGTHAQLMKKSDVYREIYEAQYS